MLALIGAKLSLPPNIGFFIIVFFIYSFLGNIMECFVLSWEHKKLITNRGFVKHLPFCIIYGFGACLGFVLLSPFSHNLLLLYTIGAIAATGLEYVTARLQIFMFGDFWWDYKNKPFNFQGVLCLESTLGWGIVATLIVKILHPAVVSLVTRIPANFATAIAVVLLFAYAIDFIYSAREAYKKKKLEAFENKLDTNETKIA